MAKIQLVSGQAFAAEAQESLLDAALRADITLDHSCRSGRCSACKARVASGTTESLHAETGLTPAESQAGWILTCSRTATSDVVLDVEVLEGVRLFPAKTFPSKIHGLERLAPDVVKITLRLPPTQVMQYFPGQYVDVAWHDRARHDSVRRSYSLANAPGPDNLLELQVRRVPGGVMSDYWFGTARVNDLLQVKGPLGSFFLREAAARHVILLATGTGIAPVKAMLEQMATLAPEQAPRSITLLWGGRVLADLYWNPLSVGVTLTYIPVLSRADADWAGARGYVQDVLLQRWSDFSGVAVYACGSDAMIDSAKTQLMVAGLHGKHFYSDAFLCSA